MDIDTRIVANPWGQGEWITLAHRYCMKGIHSKNGFRTTLQYHNLKEEIDCGDQGRMLWRSCDREGSKFTKTEMNPGGPIAVGAGMMHRVEALDGMRMIMASSPHIDDVIRLEDDFHRPAGRIDSEHGIS